MIDWLRYVGYTVLGFVILIGVGWESWILYKRREYRASDEQQQHIRESRVGWWGDQKKKDR